MPSVGSILVPSGRSIAEEIGMISSLVAHLIVPCTGGHTRSVSRTTASKNGRASIESAWTYSEYPPADEKEENEAKDCVSEGVGDDARDESE